MILKGLVDAALAGRLSETPLSPDMHLEHLEGGAMLAATVVDSWELKWWLLSQAGAIRIDEPLELREEICATLKRGLAIYSPQNTEDRANRI